MLPDGREIKPDLSSTKFNRIQEGIKNPNFGKLNTILNHFRVFSVQSFKQLPKDLMVDIFGKYYEDRVIFLMDLIDFTRIPFPTLGFMHFMRKKYFNLW